MCVLCLAAIDTKKPIRFLYSWMKIHLMPPSENTENQIGFFAFKDWIMRDANRHRIRIETATGYLLQRIEKSDHASGE